jgi:Holliday junction resolvase RusA-like endonuclease
MIAFSVQCLPIAQPRQRHRVVTTAGGKSFAQNYTPKKDPVNFFKSEIRRAFEEWQKTHGDFKIIEGPVAVTIIAVFPRPKGARWKTKAMPRYPKTSKPDLDNLGKACLDCLNLVAYHDDAQVFSLHVEKHIASGDETAHVEIKIEEAHATQQTLFGCTNN